MIATGSKTVVLLTLMLLMTSEIHVSAEGLKKASFMPQWIPQAQFAGYLVAHDLKYYREAGLDVTIFRGGPGPGPLETLRRGGATFGTGWLVSGIKKQASGVRVVNLAQIVQRSGMMLVARANKETGKALEADDLKHIEGKRVGLWEGDLRIQPLALFNLHNLKVKVIPQYVGVNLFLEGGVDVTSVMWYNEYHSILNSGIKEDELATFFFRRHGLDFPEDGIYCMQQTLEIDPKTCRRFVQASLKGWEYAFSNEEETLDIVMEHARAARTMTNRAHQKWMLARIKDMVLGDGEVRKLGTLREQDFNRVVSTLKDLKTISDAPRFSDFYRGKR
jgi:NitT/TauT family transport system substrate-binding protein